jgi:carbon starvation protein
VLAYSNAFNRLWPIFATANQLLAALGLLAIAAWLLVRGKRTLFVLVPAVFMVITTVASLLALFQSYAAQRNYPLLIANVLLLILAAGVVGLFLRTFVGRRKGTRGSTNSIEADASVSRPGV